MHNRPGLSVGQFAIRAGRSAGAAFFDIVVQGKGGHGARLCRPSTPSSSARRLFRRCSPSSRERVGIPGRGAERDLLDGGRGLQRHPRPGRAEGHGAPSAWRRLRLVEERTRAIATAIATGYGATADVHKEIAAPTINALEEATAMADAAASLVGEQHVERNRAPVMGSEDFAYMLLEKPGAYIHVGNGTGEAGGCDVHNPHYDFNDARSPMAAWNAGGAGRTEAAARRATAGLNALPQALYARGRPARAGAQALS